MEISRRCSLKTTRINITNNVTRYKYYEVTRICSLCFNLITSTLAHFVRLIDECQINASSYPIVHTVL